MLRYEQYPSEGSVYGLLMGSKCVRVQTLPFAFPQASGVVWAHTGLNAGEVCVCCQLTLRAPKLTAKRRNRVFAVSRSSSCLSSAAADPFPVLLGADCVSAILLFLGDEVMQRRQIWSSRTCGCAG